MIMLVILALQNVKTKYKKGVENKMNLFFSSKYDVNHSFVNKQNCEILLKNDIRCRLLGDVQKAIWYSNGVEIPGNESLSYVGGFYYEKEIYSSKQFGDCYGVVRNELDEIDKSDIVVVSLIDYSAMGSVSELLYAATKHKKIIIFCNDKITKFEIPYAYWFPILTTMQMTNDVKIIFVKSEDEIIEYIKKIKV